MIVLSSSADFLNIMQTILPSIFSLFTSWKLPGVNFTPAVLMFGLMSFGIAIYFIHGIITITSEGVNHNISVMNNNARSLARQKGRSQSRRR